MKKSVLGIGIGIVCSALIIGIVAATRPKQATTTSSNSKQYTANDVALHNTKTDCWMIISGSVYDVTEYVSSHPGGNEIARGCGKDATSLFNTRRDGNERVGSGTPHSSSAKATLDNFKIGTLTN